MLQRMTILTNARYNFPQPNNPRSQMSCFFLANSPKPKNIQFTIMNEKIKTFEKVEPANIWQFSWKNDQKDCSVIKYLLID